MSSTCPICGCMTLPGRIYCTYHSSHEFNFSVPQPQKLSTPYLFLDLFSLAMVVGGGVSLVMMVVIATIVGACT